MTALIWIIIALFLVVLNAFFVAAEFSMVKLRQTRLETIQAHYGLRGQILRKIHLNLDAYLSACQLGITLASLGLGWVGEPAFAELLRPIFQRITVIDTSTLHVIAFSCAFSIISFLHIVLGELMPKSLAIRQSETISLLTAIPLHVFYWLMQPAIWLLNNCANLMLKLFRLETTDNANNYSTDEIKIILNRSHIAGELSDDETHILEQTLTFTDLQVTEVMRPRDEMVMLVLQDSMDNIFKMVSKYRFSRYPVFDNIKQEIIGIVHVKDLFNDILLKTVITSLQPYVRPVLKISHHCPAIDLLRQFQTGMPHFALIYKNKTDLLGFITMDNLLHILIGRIKDEFHLTNDDWQIASDGNLIMRGDSPLVMLERALGEEIAIEAAEDEPLTVSALIIQKLGHLPQVGEKIIFKQFAIEVLKIKGSRLMSIKIIPNRES